MDDEITRRSLLKRGATAATAVGALGPTTGAAHAAVRLLQSPRRAVAAAPNVLVIIVRPTPPAPVVAGATRGRRADAEPGGAAQRRGSFASHYTAANDCTPARGTLLTGLYSHQTGCLVTGGSTLAPAFPTWGTMLRERAT